MMVEVSAQSSLILSTQKGKKAPDDPATARPDFTFWCFIKDDPPAFQVTVPANANGNQLKKGIWEEAKGQFEPKRINARHLVVYKVNEKILVDPNEDLAERASSQLGNLASTTKLSAWTKLSEVFPEQLDEKYLHVFVTLPSVEPALKRKAFALGDEQMNPIREAEKRPKDLIIFADRLAGITPSSSNSSNFSHEQPSAKRQRLEGAELSRDEPNGFNEGYNTPFLGHGATKSVKALQDHESEFHIRPTTPDNMADPSIFEEFDRTINTFLEKHRPRMQELVGKTAHVSSILPSWKSDPSVDETLAKHISELCIPLVSGGQPSLLLHDLGGAKNDPRISDIFSFAHHTVLINTSGSGKTRLLLDGLCHRWGFYFVAKPDLTGIGSSDLWEFMHELDKAEGYKRAKEKKEVDPTSIAAIEHLRQAAERRLAQLLLARFLLLQLLVEEAQRLPGELTEELKGFMHRRLWVLLQVQPSIFGDVKDDIFISLARLLRHATLSQLKDRIGEAYQQIKHVLSKVQNPTTSEDDKPPFFCVLDEGQVTTTLRISDNKKEHPLMQVIWSFLTTVLKTWQMRFVVSGTGIDFEALKDALESSFLKGSPYYLKHDVGAFDDSESQAEYIKRYVPAPWIDQHWAEFLVRAWAWFRGRHRSTAILVLLILEGGYNCPHRTIDEYVKAFTGFKPTDGKEWTDMEAQFPPGFSLKSRINKLNFDKMSEPQTNTVADAIYDQILYGRYFLSNFSSEERETLVEFGFAQHKPRSDITVFDEPLVILAAWQGVNQKAAFSLFACLRRDIQSHSKRKNGFEAYLAFHLRKVFEAAPELDTVFTFREDFARRDGADIPWQHEQFELVTVVTVDNTPRVSVVTPSCGPSSNVGFLADSGKEVLDWISTNDDEYTFCFPQESFGPDVLFFVQSRLSRRLLLVAIHAKKYDVVDQPTLIHGVRAVTPSWFWKSKDKKHPTADAAPFITNEKNDCRKLAAQTKDALAAIPLGLKVDGADYPILRVFASWEGEAKLERTMAWIGKKQGKGKQKKRETSMDDVVDPNVVDPDKHPLATLHLVNFREVAANLNRNWFRGDVEQKMVVYAKRPREHDFGPLRVQKSARLAHYYG